MKKRALAVLLLQAGFGMPGAVNAAIPTGLPETMAESAATPRGTGMSSCTLHPSFGPRGIGDSDDRSQSTGLLGRVPSQLEVITRQQGDSPASRPVASAAATVASDICSNTHGLANIVPAIGRMTGSEAIVPSRSPRPEDFLGSRRLPIAHTVFDTAWARVSERALPGRVTRGLALVSSNLDQHFRIATINAWANAHIRYVEDLKLYRKADFWADAQTTLNARAGDCEDIAILKLQLLAAAGIPRDAMFLTIARDLVRRTDHALLVVRDGETYWLLDNTTNSLVDARAAVDYRPIMSFSGRGKWLHGY